VVLVEETEDVGDETRLLTRDASCAASLREVLAGETCSDDVDVARQSLEVPDVRLKRDAGEPLGENGLGRSPYFAEQSCLKPSLLQTELKTAHTREETRDS
jgi:hypothetical protein